MYKANNNTVALNTFKATFETDDGKEISVSVFPPKMAVMQALQKIDDQSPDALDDMASAIAKLLSRNKEGRKFTAEEVSDLLDVFDINDFLTDYYNWVGELKKK